MEALKNKKLKQIKDNFFKNGFVVLKNFIQKKKYLKFLIVCRISSRLL